MFSLVKKDLKLFVGTNIFMIFAFAFPITLSIVGIRSKSEDILINTMYILSIFMITYFTIMYSNGYDQKNKADIILNSFPINKKDIVRGKYLLVLFCSIGYSLFIIILTNVFILIGFGEGGEPASIWDLIVAMDLILIFYSIYYPLYFKSEKGLAAFNQIIYMIIVLSPGIFARFGKILYGTKIFNAFMEMNIQKISIVLLGFAIIAYLISLQVSEIIYTKKEF